MEGLPLSALGAPESHQYSPVLQIFHPARTPVKWGGWQVGWAKGISEQMRIFHSLPGWFRRADPTLGSNVLCLTWEGNGPYRCKRSPRHAGWCHRERQSPLITPWWSHSASSCLRSCSLTLQCLKFTKIFWLQSIRASTCTHRLQLYFTAGWQDKEKEMNAELIHFNALARVAGRDFLPLFF